MNGDLELMVILTFTAVIISILQVPQQSTSSFNDIERQSHLLPILIFKILFKIPYFDSEPRRKENEEMKNADEPKYGTSVEKNTYTIDLQLGNILGGIAASKANIRCLQ